jgi:hypothetical protein
MSPTALLPHSTSLYFTSHLGSAYSLLFDGKRIMDEETAQDLDMEEGDAIEVLLEREWHDCSNDSAGLRTPTRHDPQTGHS